MQRSAVHDVLGNPGQPVAAPCTADAEGGPGVDFSHVPVRTGSAASAFAAEAGARAYTRGSHVSPGRPLEPAVREGTETRFAADFSNVPARTGAAPPVVHEALRGPGAPLDARTRNLMEKRLGTDFSHVRVHTDERAAASAHAINALAYTVGSSIVFSSGRYAPHSDDGQRLLAHELVHTVQQGRWGTPFSGQRLSVESSASFAEHQAEMIGAAAAPPGVSGTSLLHGLSNVSQAPRPIGCERIAGGKSQFPVAPTVQRQIKISGGRMITSETKDSYLPGIGDKLAKLARGRGWDETRVDAINDRIERMINAEATYPTQGQFSSYQQLIMLVARGITAERGPQRTALGGQLPSLAPELIGSSPAAGSGPTPNLLPAVRRRASRLRLFPHLIPEEFQMGAGRRGHAQAGTLDSGLVQPVAIGQFSGEVRLSGSVLTPSGGGRGGTYAELWNQFTLEAGSQDSPRTTQQAAGDILAMLHGRPSNLLTHYSPGTLLALDHILTVLAGAEQARATSAVLHFAATINEVAQGHTFSTFSAAFAGPQASFLGAGEGGAAALRGETPPALHAQEQRAADSLDRYLQTYGGSLHTHGLVRRLLNNIASYSRQRHSAAGGGTAGHASPASASSSPSPMES